MHVLLDVQQLSVSFDTHAGEVKAVNKINFQVYGGEAVAIVGESGCGKSVTAHSIMRLLPTPPARYAGGGILFNGQDLLQKSAKEMEEIRGNDISMIFQDPMTSLNPVLTIGRQITESLERHQHLTRRQADSRAVELLRLVGIPSPEQRLSNYPHQFSGGMRQRAMIAIALACSPKLLLADEPTTALDVTMQAQILDLMKKLQTESNTAIVFISHDLGAVAGLCSRVLVMYAGAIVETGSAADIFHHARHPYTWGLLQAVPRLDTGRGGKLAVIDGQPPDLLKPPTGCPFHPRCPYAMRICREQFPVKTAADENHLVHCWLEHAAAPKPERQVALL